MEKKNILFCGSGEISRDGLYIKLNGKRCITPEYIVNEIKTHLYHPED